MASSIHLRRVIGIVLIFLAVPCRGTESTHVYPGDKWDYWESCEAAGYCTKAIGEARQFVVSGMNTTGLMVIVGGKVLVEYGDVEELSYLASCRKSVLAMLYGRYVENGTIDLDATLESLNIDDHGGLLPVEKKATVRHLLIARSGVYHAASNWGDYSASAPERGSQQPGKYFLYNNWDFNAAGAVFEQVTGTDIYDALENDLAIPLQMQDFKRSTQQKEGDLEISKFPAYHMVLSTRDMARLGYLMLRNGKWKDEQVIPAAWVKEIVSVVTPVRDMNPPSLREQELAYGYMWWLWPKDGEAGPFQGGYSAGGLYGHTSSSCPRWIWSWPIRRKWRTRDQRHGTNSTTC